MKTISSDPLTGSEIYFYTPTMQGKQMFLYPLCMGHFFCDETYGVARQSYDSYLLMYVKNGEGYISFAGELLPIRAGQIVLMNCYEAHKYGATGKLEFYWLHFDGPLARRYYEYLTEQKQGVFTVAESHETQIAVLFKQLLAGISGKYILKEIQFNKYIVDMVTVLAMSAGEIAERKAELALADTPMQNKVMRSQDTSEFACERAKAYIQQHFTKPLLIPEVAQYVSLSPYYFIRRFKELFGMTPHRYLLKTRLDSAQFFLKTTNRSIKDIAISSGFQCENHFCIAFKNQLGVTPSAFRKQKNTV